MKLLNNLRRISLQQKVLFGRHNEFLSGLSNTGKFWTKQFTQIEALSNSDIKRITGQYPGIMNVDIGTKALNYGNKNDFDNLKYCILSYYEQVGGVITISCHLGNPWWYVEKGDGEPYRYKSKKHSNPVSDILNGHVVFKENETVKDWYDKKIATLIQFISSLKDDDGTLIPVIFRPFHEASHDAFWWGYCFCSNDDYIKLFRYTVERLRTKCSNILIAYSPDNNWTTLSSSDRYMDRYPGDQYVDILGMDSYGLDNEKSMNKCVEQLVYLSTYAKTHNKVVALTETGNKGLKVPQWFCKRLYPILVAEDVNVAYIVVWGSWSVENGFLVPYKINSEEAKDFKRFVKKKQIYMSKKIKKLHLYE